MPMKFHPSKINLTACCGMTSWDIGNSALSLTMTFVIRGQIVGNDLNNGLSVTRLTDLHKNELSSSKMHWKEKL